MKQAYLVHGWDGSPTNCWFPWIKKELENLGYKVKALKMPHPETPIIKDWVSTLEKEIKIGEETILIGHSIGCQTIMRYLEKSNRKVKAVFFAAPWFHLNNEEDSDEAKEIAKPWLNTKINFIAIKKNCNKFTAFFSTDDPVVPLSDAKLFQKELNARIIILKDRSHFEIQTEFQELLNEIRKL
ncbi:serine hydrolase family protein [Candidatus Woesearchaeota archaeon]|nr:serine hydrolase family protein [Candidatus Woesearchaeota archaeon]